MGEEPERHSKESHIAVQLMSLGTHSTTGQLIKDTPINPAEINQDLGTQQETSLVAVFSHLECGGYLVCSSS